jgi:seryl-tRNA synthetase
VKFFEATAQVATNENDRKLLNAAASDLRGLRPRVEKEIPANLNALHGLMQQMQTDGEVLAQQIAAQQAKMAEMSATAAAAAAAVPAVPVPTVPEEAKVDLGLGAALRTDLLNKLFPEAKPAEAFDPGKDIWQDWK